MKFEKFLKNVGTHGRVIERNNGDKWLVSGSVGMKIPDGVDNLLGSVKLEGDEIFYAILQADTSDDTLTLKRAVLNEADGKANDIIRVFETVLDIDLLSDEVGISNRDYGLLEKHDKLTYLEIEDIPDHNGDLMSVKFIVILDRRDNEPIGFITGVKDI